MKSKKNNRFIGDTECFFTILEFYRTTVKKNEELDSIINTSITIGDATLGLLDMPGIEKVSVSNLSKRELDSIFILSYLLIRSHESLDSIQNKRIDSANKILRNKENIIYALKKQIENKNEIEKNLNNIIGIYKNATKWGFYRFLFVSILALIASYFAIKQYRKKRRNEIYD